MKRELTTLVQLRLKCSTVEVLRDEARPHNQGVSWMIRQALAEYCERHHIHHDPQLEPWRREVTG